MWSLPSSLLALGPGLVYQPAGASTGRPQAKQSARWGDTSTYQQEIRLPEPTACLGHSAGHQKVQGPGPSPQSPTQNALAGPQDMTLPTSEPALASGTVSHTSGQEPDTLGPSPPHQQVNTSPKTTIFLQPGMAGPSSHQQVSTHLRAPQAAGPPTIRSTQLEDNLDPSASCRRIPPYAVVASTSFETPQTPQLAMSGTSLDHY